ncbi:MAG: hypothetical protein ACX93J_14375 [Flagellimonas marinaquae]
MIHLARILNNEHNWVSPSGTQQVNGFTQIHGFGYEEWLNSTYLSTKKYKYGFIESLHGRQPNYNLDRVYLFTYRNSVFKIVGAIRNIRVIPINERFTIENELIAHNQDGFFKDIEKAHGNIPEHENDRRFKVNFIVDCSSDFILDAKRAIDVSAGGLYNELGSHMIAHRMYRLSVLYKFPSECVHLIEALEADFLRDQVTNDLSVKM